MQWVCCTCVAGECGWVLGPAEPPREGCRTRSAPIDRAPAPRAGEIQLYCNWDIFAETWHFVEEKWKVIHAKPLCYQNTGLHYSSVIIYLLHDRAHVVVLGLYLRGWFTVIQAKWFDIPGLKRQTSAEFQSLILRASITLILFFSQYISNR